jgi:uncharacterized membrane protein
MSQPPDRFTLSDLAQIAVGACVMGFPVATAQEIWDLSVALTLRRTLLFAVASLLSLAALIFVLHGSDTGSTARGTHLRRVLSTYGLTIVISALLLFGVDRLDLFGHPLVALKRTILVAFPASFAATVVDKVAGS